MLCCFSATMCQKNDVCLDQVLEDYFRPTSLFFNHKIHIFSIDVTVWRLFVHYFFFKKMTLIRCKNMREKKFYIEVEGELKDWLVIQSLNNSYDDAFLELFH
jgi:hypothetical protein